MASVKHYLITIDLSPKERMHGYLMSKDKKDIERVLNHMLDAAEKAGHRPSPISLVTPLDTGIEVVRRIASENPEIAKLLKAATNFHMSIFSIPVGCEWDHQLMGLH